MVKKSKALNIIHLSDIHIRPLERHIEYTQVFEKVYSYLETLKQADTYVFLTGDILHNKDKILSETLIVLNDFIENLCSRVSFVYMIPGNHDAYKSNDRLDALYGLTAIKKYPNFMFFNKSSMVLNEEKFNVVYNHFNGEFFDFNSLVENGSLDTNKPSISLYHGLVSTNNDSIVFGKKSKNICDFENFNLALLGDLHNYHKLSDRVGYAGSLIQQNFGEEVDKGFIHWTLCKSAVESKFIKVENESSFVNVFVDESLNLSIMENNALYSLEDHKLKFFRKNTKVRLVLDVNPIHCNLDFLKGIEDSLFKAVGDCFVIVNKQFKNTVENVLTEKQTVDKKEDELIKVCLKSILDESYTDEILKEILELHSVLKGKVNYTQECFNQTWFIKRLEFKNVFIYGGNHVNVIDFTNANEVIGILGNNAIGKSCILYIIIYGLFGYITKSKNFTNKNILNKSAKDFYIKLTVNVNGCEYLLHRYSTKKVRTRKNVSSVEEQLEFFEINSDGDTVDLSCTTKTDTEKTIKHTLGLSNKDDFIFTNVISNIIDKNVLTMSNSELDEILGNLFNTKVYKLLQNYCKEHIKELQLKASNIKGQLEGNSNSNDQSIINEMNNGSVVSEARLKELDKKENAINKQLKVVKLNSSKVESKVKVLYNEIHSDDSNSLMRELLTVENKIEFLLNGIQKTEDDTLLTTPKELEKKLILLKNKLSQFKAQNDLEYTRPDIYDEETDYIEVVNNLQQFIDEHDLVLEDNSENTKINLNDIQTIKKKLNKINECKELDNGLLNKIKLFFSNYLTNCKSIVAQYNKRVLNDVKDKYNEYLYCLKYDNYLKYLQLNEEYTHFKKLLQIAELKERVQLIKKAKEYSEIVNEELILKETLVEIDKERFKINVILEAKNRTKDKEIELTNELKSIDIEIKMYTLYKSLVSDKYLPKLILQQTIEVLQKEANELIYTLCNITIEFQTTDSFKWNILIHKNDITLNSEQCSGYERFIINVALKIAFDKYKFYSGIKMFFIDEGLDCISEENYDKIDVLFGLLKSYYNTVLVISHNEALKQKVERSINITSNFQTSKIVS